MAKQALRSLSTLAMVAALTVMCGWKWAAAVLAA